MTAVVPSNPTMTNADSFRHELSTSPKANNNVPTAPPVYGTKNPFMKPSNDKIESFGWNDNADQSENLFSNSNSNNNIKQQPHIPAVIRSDVVQPFAGTDSIKEKEKVIDTKPKRKGRK